MGAEASVLVGLVGLVDRIPLPPPPPPQRGRPRVYPDRLFLKALVIMIVRHVPKVQTLLSMLAEPTAEMARLRALLLEQGRYPSRRTWERRLRAMPDSLPAQIGCLGRHLVTELAPGPRAGRQPPLTAPSWRPAAVSGTKSIARRASCRTVRLIPRRAGRNRDGMGGSMGGNCIWSPPSPPSGSPWPPR